MLNLLVRNNGLIGVDLGAYCLKVAQLVRRGRELVVERAVVFERTAAAPDDSAPAASRVNSEVGELLRGCDQFAGRDAAAILSMAECEYQSEPIEPNLTTAEIEQIAQRLAARERSLSKQLQHDYWTTPGGDDGSATLHVLATADRTTLEVDRVHRAAGLGCVAIDGLPAALARAVRLGGYQDDAPIAAIDWGRSRVTFCIVLRGRPVFMRSFARGALTHFIDPLRQSLSLTHREARELLTSIGLTDTSSAAGKSPTQTMIAQSTAAAMQEFQAELDRTLSFLKDRHRAYYPRQIVLFGGGATIANAALRVGEHTGIEASVWTFPHVNADDAHDSPVPTALLAPAIALSALAWESA